MLVMKCVLLFGDVGDEICFVFVGDVGDEMCFAFGDVGDEMCLLFDDVDDDFSDDVDEDFHTKALRRSLEYCSECLVQRGFSVFRCSLLTGGQKFPQNVSHCCHAVKSFHKTCPTAVAVTRTKVSTKRKTKKQNTKKY